MVSLKGILTAIGTLCLWSAEGLSTVDRLSANLQVHYEVIQNPTASLTETCKSLKADWGLCSRVALHLRYSGNDDVSDSNWVIYIHSIRRILKLDTDLFTVNHVNGDLHKLTPTAKFQGFRAKQSIKVPMIVEYWIITYSDIMPNVFIASSSQAKAIKNTQDLTKLGDFSSGITGTNLKRTDGDMSTIMTPATRFDRNERDNLRLLDGTSIRGVIIPTPKSVKVGDADADLSNGIRITGSGWDSFSATTKEAITRKFKTFGIEIVPKEEAGKAYQIIVLEGAGASEEIDPYSLQIGKLKTEIKGNKQGAFYGLQSFLSLIKMGSFNVPTIDVKDSARFRHRGMMADVGRNFKSKEAILRLIDQMAYLKLNTFHFHVSDDEGWRVEIPGLEELTSFGSKRCFSSDCLLPQLGSGPTEDNQGSGFYSVADYEEIVKYANARYIKVVPEFDMPGHARAAVMSMERRYLKYKDQDQSKADEYRLLDPDDKSNFLSVQYYDRTTALNPCMASTYNFITKVITEVQKMHERAGQPLKEWHFGGDEAHNIFLKGGYKSYNYSDPQHEPWEESKICKDAKAEIKKLPYQFMKKVKAILKSKGISIMYAWSDAAGHPAYDVQDLGETVKVTMWDTLEWGAANRFQELAKAGFRVINSLPDFLYFDMPYEASPFERGYYWATRYQDLRKVYSLSAVCIPQNVEYTVTRMGGTFPNQKIEQWPSYKGIPFQFDGIQGQVWCESVRTDEQFEYMIFPRLIAVAERAWHKASWEKDEKTCEGTTFGHGADGKPLNTNIQEINDGFNIFANVLGQRELLKMDKEGVRYRLPLPGYKVRHGELKINNEIPGLNMEYSLDGGKSWTEFNDKAKPVVTNPSLLRVRTLSPDGSRSRTEQKEMRWPDLSPQEICMQSIEGIFQHPTDCAKFLHCANGAAFIKACPPGLLFNPSKKICDYADAVVCA